MNKVLDRLSTGVVSIPVFIVFLVVTAGLNDVVQILLSAVATFVVVRVVQRQVEKSQAAQEEETLPESEDDEQ